MTGRVSRFFEDLSRTDVGSSGLAHMSISSGRTPGDTDATYSVLYNPTTLRIERQISWETIATTNMAAGTHQVEQRFGGPTPATLHVDFFFDTYEDRRNPSAPASSAARKPPEPFDAKGITSTDVRRHTDQIARLGDIDRELHRPPTCRLQWGAMRFDGVMASITETFTMFLADGTPVRATVSCRFLEVDTDARTRALEMHSSDVRRVHTCVVGDTLWSLADTFYGDSRRWRLLADVNGNLDARRLPPGMLIEVPPL